MIDLFDKEKLLTFARAAELLPRDTRDRKVKVATLVRYAIRGIRKVRLEAAYFDGRWYTTREAINAFCRARGIPAIPPPASSPREIARLESLGLMPAGPSASHCRAEVLAASIGP